MGANSLISSKGYDLYSLQTAKTFTAPHAENKNSASGLRPEPGCPSSELIASSPLRLFDKRLKIREFCTSCQTSGVLQPQSNKAPLISNLPPRIKRKTEMPRRSVHRLADLVIYGVARGASRRIVSAVSLSHSCSGHLCPMAAAEVAPSDRRVGSPDAATARCATSPACCVLRVVGSGTFRSSGFTLFRTNAFFTCCR